MLERQFPIALSAWGMRAHAHSAAAECEIFVEAKRFVGACMCGAVRRKDANEI